MVWSARTNDQPRASAPAPPPAGAISASFVLFASLAALLAMLYAGGEWWNLVGGFGFPSDDAWVRAVFARNLASGEGVCFNPGSPTAGAAGLSWIALLSAFNLLGGDPVLFAKIAGVASLALASFLAWQICLKLLGDWRFAFLAGLLTAASPRLIGQGLSGTEATWSALLVMAAIDWQAAGWDGTNRQRALGAIATGLAALARPELVLLLPLILVDRWLLSLRHFRPGRRLSGGLLRGLPEIGGAAAVVAPFVVHNLKAGGPLWQQPEIALRPVAIWGWGASALHFLWSDNPVVLCAALLGLLPAAAWGLRVRSQHRCSLIALVPLTALIVPGLAWRQAGVQNAAFTATYLTPLFSILATAGLFALYRVARHWAVTQPSPARRLVLGAALALGCASVFGFVLARHPAAWRQHGFQVKKVADLQVYLGRWAADHLPADASIAAREVGAIRFFSRRRVVDLGGAVSKDALLYLRRPGSPDSNLLQYLEWARPSHLAIRPADFPDLSQRADLLTPVLTCVVTDPISGGVTTMALYATPWPPLSVMHATQKARRR